MSKIKQKRDAQVTKAKILTESRLLFSKKGFDATTIEDIAKESGVNKALIYYYFKNKSGLYSSVMSELFDVIYMEVLEARDGCESVVDELSSFVFTYANYAEKNPYFPALLLRELSDSGAHLPDMMFASMRRLFALLGDILERGEREGVFKKSISMVVHFMIIGSLNLMITTKPLRQKAMEIDKDVDTSPESSIDVIAKYVFESIKISLEVK